jgi:protein SCO1
MHRNRISTHRLLKLAAAVIALTFFAAACGRGEKGSYPAANRNDCLPNVTLTDQNGNAVTLAALKGAPVLIDFVYTSCTSTCPLLTAKMVAIARKLRPELGTGVRIVTITLDPEHDRPAELRDYARREGASEPGWLFLTGSPANVDAVLARFRIERARGPDGSITHTISAFLLGPDGHQVRQYNALEVNADTVAADVSRARARG